LLLTELNRCYLPRFMQKPKDQVRDKIDTEITKGSSKVDKGFYVDKCDRLTRNGRQKELASLTC
jgi:hypothetical protein